jgi:hypothetical protein
MSDPKWIRYPDPSDMDGFNLPGLELFLRGGQVASVIRETGQNTIDNPDESTDVTELSYRRYEIPTADFPGRQDLISIIKACLKFGMDSGQEPEDDSMKFIQRALEMLMNDEGTIPMLEISDKHTTGIEGADHEFSQPWARMTEAIGISDGANSTRGGSRGIGKFAPLLLSNLRTMFISTKTINGVAFKGTAQFTSYQDQGTDYSAKIKYQIGKKESVRDESLIPKYFIRQSIGTSIHVAGFNLDKNWMDQIIEAVLSNFYAAIQQGKLIVKGEGHLLNQTTINNYIASHADDQTKMFYRCLTEGERISDNLMGFGQVELYVKIDEDFSKRIDHMRDKRMKIFDEKKGPLLTKNYAAVFICSGEEGSKRLRLMEGAEHVSWKARDSTDDKKYLDKLKEWINNHIRAFEPEDEDEESSVSGTEDLLPMVDEGSGDGSGGAGGQAQEEETAKEKIIDKKDKLEIPDEDQVEIIVINSDGSVSVIKRKEPTKKKRVKSKSRPEPDPNPKPRKTKQKPKKVNVDWFESTIIKNDSEPKEYHLFIESDIDREIEVDLEIFAVAEHGERIPSFSILKGAKYPDNSKIAKVGGLDQLKKVKIIPGINKIILSTKEDYKYAFNIEGHESK